MNKQEGIFRLEELLSVLKQLPDDASNGLSFEIENCESIVSTEVLCAVPQILFCFDASFTAAAQFFGKETMRVKHNEEYDEEAFYVDGVRLFRCLVRREKADHE